MLLLLPFYFHLSSRTNFVSDISVAEHLFLSMYHRQQQCKIDCLFIYITVNISVVVFPRLYECKFATECTCEREISKEIDI